MNNSLILSKDIANIDELVTYYNQKKIISLPTDTCFGFSCIYDDTDAIQRLKKIKNRDANKPFPILVDTIERISSIAYTSIKSDLLSNRFLPGPLTLVLKKKDIINNYITNNKNTVAIRICNDTFLIELVKRLNKPIVLTSANLSNEQEIYSQSEIYSRFNGIIDIMVDGEISCANPPTTIVEIIDNNVKILRVGSISEKEIMEALK